MKLYQGVVASRSWRVVVASTKSPYELDPRHDLRNHSPDGFAWGYEGSGPAQLSLALLADAMGDEKAQELYQDFKRLVIARLDQAENWVMSENIVRIFAEFVARRRG